MTVYSDLATITKIVDGDTVRVSVDLGYKVTMAIEVRINGIDAPEMWTPEGKAARVFICTLIAPGQVVLFHSVHLLNDKYGRCLGDIELADGRSVAQAMLDAGHAVAYSGGKR